MVALIFRLTDRVGQSLVFSYVLLLYAPHQELPIFSTPIGVIRHQRLRTVVDTKVTMPDFATLYREPLMQILDTMRIQMSRTEASVNSQIILIVVKYHHVI